MTATEMHALEKAALEDPFLAEAMEGYADNRAALPGDMDDLNARINRRVENNRVKTIPLVSDKRSFPWLKLVAMIVIIAGAATLIYQFAFHSKDNDLAQAVDREKVTVRKEDSLSPAQSNSAQSKDTTNQPVIILQQTRPEPQKTENAGTGNQSSVTEKAKQQSDTTNNHTLIAVKPKEDVAPVASAKEPEEKELQQEEIAGNKQDRQADKLRVVNAARTKQAAAQGFSRQSNMQTAAPFIFRGRVTDQQNNALPFSNIINTRDSVGTYADANGFFNLVSPDSILRVRVSSIGFEPSVVSLQKDLPSNLVKLENDESGLAEVVVSSKKVNTSRVMNNMVLGDAEPADGWPKYDLYLANNIKEPDYLSEKKPAGYHGEVVLSFEVSKSGEPVNITVRKSLCDACDREAIRLLKEGPKWKRKAKRGRTTVTVRF